MCKFVSEATKAANAVFENPLGTEFRDAAELREYVAGADFVNYYKSDKGAAVWGYKIHNGEAHTFAAFSKMPRSQFFFVKKRMEADVERERKKYRLIARTDSTNDFLKSIGFRQVNPTIWEAA